MACSDNDLPYEKDKSGVEFQQTFATYLEETKYILTEDGTSMTGPCPRCEHTATFVLSVIVDRPNAAIDQGAIYAEDGQDQATEMPVEFPSEFVTCGCECAHGRGEPLKGCGLVLTIKK